MSLETKMAREMLRFTKQTGAGGCESRMCETAVARYVRAMFRLARLGPRCKMCCTRGLRADFFWWKQLQIARRLITVG